MNAQARFREDLADAARRQRRWQAARAATPDAVTHPGRRVRSPGLSNSVGPLVFYGLLAVGCLAWGLFPWLLGGVCLGLGSGLLLVRLLRILEGA